MKNPSSLLVRARPPRAFERSNRTTFRPCRARRTPAARPPIPPPTIAISGSNALRTTINLPPWVVPDYITFEPSKRLQAVCERLSGKQQSLSEDGPLGLSCVATLLQGSVPAGWRAMGLGRFTLHILDYRRRKLTRLELCRAFHLALKVIGDALLLD